MRPRLVPNPIGVARLRAQQLRAPRYTTAAEVVSWLGAVQAQDYAAAKWAVGLRLPEGTATEASIERALEAGSLVRTHAMRGTWQLIAPADLRWLTALVAPRLKASNARRYRELDEPTFGRSEKVIRKALAKGQALTRAELVLRLEEAGISAVGQRFPYLLQRAELDAVVCNGPLKGKQRTWSLVEARVPSTGPSLNHEEALAELVRRYFLSRGPATEDDCSWWTGLPLSEIRRGLAAVKAGLVSEVIGGTTYWSGEAVGRVPSTQDALLLPAFDEYLVGYRDRSAVLELKEVKRLNAGGGMLNPSVVIDGHVAGTWRRELSRDGVRVELELFKKASAAELKRISAAANRYGAFLGLEASLEFPG